MEKIGNCFHNTGISGSQAICIQALGDFVTPLFIKGYEQSLFHGDIIFPKLKIERWIKIKLKSPCSLFVHQGKIL